MLALLLCVGVAAAARLDNNYLPPSSARTAGGNGRSLAAPGVSNGRQFAPQSPVQQYGAPAPEHAIGSVPQNGLSSTYGAPSNAHYNRNGGAHNSAEARANILRFNNENNGDGNYRFEYETENKISQQEVGQVKNIGPDGDATVVQGTYSYVGDDGHTYTVNYIADENGFQPTGDHIHQEIQMAAAEAARSAVSEVGYASPSVSNGQNGYRY